MKSTIITPEYISGLVQADGSFHCKLSRRRNNIYLSPVFSIRQNKKNNWLIFQIQNLFQGIGHYSYNKKDETILYEVTKLKDLYNVIIPFFIKHDLKSEKHISLLKFSFIVESLYLKKQLNNRNNLIDLIVLSYQINPMSKIGNSIRYLKEDEKNKVINNITFDFINKELKNKIDNYSNLLRKKLIPFNKDYLFGLFDGDGSISLTITPRKDIRITFSIVQDIYNKILLDNIQTHFQNKGHQYSVSKNAIRYDVKSIQDIKGIIFPLFLGTSWRTLIDLSFHEINHQLELKNKENIFIIDYNLPIIKGYKFIYISKIFLIIENNKNTYKHNQDLWNEILNLSYLIKNKNNISFDEYKVIIEKKINSVSIY